MAQLAQPAEQPNQYHTPCKVIAIIDGRRLAPTNFSDLQMAYLHCKKMVTHTDRTWHIKSWETTIQLLYEYHTEDGSGLDVARSVDGDVVSIYYEL